MTLTFAELLQQLRQATSAEALFPQLQTLSLPALKQQYRLLAALVHPDYNRQRPDEAAEAFMLLQQWYAAAQQQLSGAPERTARIEITTRHRRYVTASMPWAGDLCDLYLAEAEQQPYLLKVVRTAHNNDLMGAEAKALWRIAHDLAGEQVRAHFPTLIEQVQLRDVAGVQRYVNVLDYAADFVTLAEVVRAYPSGIATADAAWMFNRILAALGVTHQLGLVHGAVTLDHVLICPSDHNGRLLDWCYSVPIGATIKAMNLAYTADYPPEVPARQPATAATDLYMAARCLLRLLGGNLVTGQLPATVPRPIELFLRGCLLPAPHRRPNDAWELLDEFQAILRHLYGPPRFRPFRLPP